MYSTKLDNNKKTIEIKFVFPWTAMLGFLFVTLKLSGVINWSWFLVTLPFWGIFGVFLGCIMVLLFLAGLTAAILFSIEWISNIFRSYRQPWKR